MTESRRIGMVVAVAAIALAWTLAGGAQAEEIDRTLQAARDGVVEIENVAGTVEVVGWDRSEVRVTGRLGEGTEGLEFERQGERVVVAVRLPRNARNVKGSDLTISVPAGSRLSISTVSADQAVSDVQGDLDLQSVSGDIRAQGGARRAKLKTVSGRIGLDIPGERVQAGSVSGDIAISGARGEVAAETVSGDIEIENARCERLHGESVSGDLSFAGELVGRGDFALSSHSGDISLRLASEPGVQLEASTFSGTIDAPFAREARPARDRRSSPTKKLRTELGDGRGKLEIETFSGDIEVRIGR